MQPKIQQLITDLTATSTSEQINEVLKAIAFSGPDPITLDKCLRAVAKQLDIGIKAVRQSYDFTLKELSLKPADLGFAIAKILLTETYNGGLRLKLTPDGLFYAFEKTHWQHVPENKIRAQIQTIAAEYKLLTDKSLHSMVMDAFGSLKDYLGSSYDALSLTDEPLPVINCLNGEVWIGQDGSPELRPHKPESLLRYCLPYNFDPTATCPVFDQTMLEIFAEAEEPAEMVRHASELLGYAIQPRRPIPCFWLLIGHGANGKTKFQQTLSRLISADYLHNIDFASFGKDKFNTSQLPGKLVMIDDDMKMETALPDGVLKKLSESKLFTARQPYGKQSFTFLNTALPIMVGNHYPHCDDLSHGLLRRVMVIPFRKQFLPHEQDNGKFEHIWQHEMAGVLNRAIEGYQRIIQRNHHFAPPSDCVEARHEFLAHGNPFYCFLTDCLQKDPESRVLFPDLRGAYQVWAKQQNLANLSVPNKTLKRRLQALGYEILLYKGYPSIVGYKLKMDAA